QRSSERAKACGAAERYVGPAHCGEQPGPEGGGERDDALQLCVEAEWALVCVNPAGQQQGARAQPADEEREHGRRGGGGGAENQPELPRPAHLIDKPAEAGGGKERPDGGERAAIHGADDFAADRTASRSDSRSETSVLKFTMQARR